MTRMICPKIILVWVWQQGKWVASAGGSSADDTGDMWATAKRLRTTGSKGHRLLILNTTRLSFLKTEHKHGNVRSCVFYHRLLTSRSRRIQAHLRFGPASRSWCRHTLSRLPFGRWRNRPVGISARSLWPCFPVGLRVSERWNGHYGLEKTSWLLHFSVSNRSAHAVPLFVCLPIVDD